MLRQVLEKLDGKTILFFPNFNPNIKTIVHVHPETSLNQTHIFETVHKEYWWMCLSCNRYVQCLSWTNSIHKKCIKYLKRNNGGKKSQHQWRCWGACHLDNKISWLGGGNFQSQMLLYGPLALVVLRMLQWQLLDEKPKTNNDGCIEEI